MGSMIAWRLADRGVPVTVFEQFSPGHDRSAAGGETRIFRTAYVEGPQYVPLLRRARELWHDLEAASGRQLLRETGVLSIGDKRSPAMRNALAGIKQFDLDCDVLGGREIRTRFPQHAVTDADTAILDRAGGYVRPELSVATAAARAEELGAEVRRFAPVVSVEPDGDNVVVRETAHAHRFTAAVIAAGPWAARLLPRLRDVLEVQRRLQAWFLPRTPALWFDQDCPVFMRTGDDDRYYGIPSVDGISIKVGVTGDLDDPVANPDELNRTVELARLEPHRTVLTTYLPDLTPDPIRVAAYQEAYTPDRHALLGRVPGSDNLIMAAGFSGHGFKLAPAIGDTIADLITSGTPRSEISHLNPARLEALRS